MDAPTLVPLTLVVFLAFVTEAIVGFGGTALTVTLGSFLLPLDQLLPAFVPVNVLLSLTLAMRGRSAIDGGFLLRRAAPALALGTAVGLALFELRGRLEIQLAFAVFVVLLATIELRRTLGEPSASSEGPLAPAASAGLLLCGGVIHGLFGSGGPMIVYVANRHLKERGALRSTLSLLWLVLNLVLVANYARLGLIDARSLGRGAAMLPALGAALLLGEPAHRKIPAGPFRRLVAAVLLVAGGSLAARTLGTLWR